MAQPEIPVFPAGEDPSAWFSVERRLAVLERVRAVAPEASPETVARLASWAWTGAVAVDTEQLQAAAAELAGALGKDWHVRDVRNEALGITARVVATYLAT